MNNIPNELTYMIIAERHADIRRNEEAIKLAKQSQEKSIIGRAVKRLRKRI